MLILKSMSKNIIIAIDGPAASGKSTVAKYLARKLNYTYIDTGAMYRAITYTVLQENIADDTQKIIDLVKTLDIKLQFKNNVTHVFVNNKEVTDKIRTPEVNSKVSEISKIPEVRRELVKIQRKMGESGNLVAEGRDTTTVVFPNADIKIFLTATVEERTKRRFNEYLDEGKEVSLEDVKINIVKRDWIDSNRKISPLTKAEKAVEIDTTNLSVKEELDIIIKKVNQLNSHY